MIVKINHSGYLVMDTCCFGNYCMTEEERKKAKGIHFNYKGIEEYVEEENVLPVITPYTLYECIQNCDTADEMLRQFKAFINAGKFFVINVNKIFDHSIIYGPTIVSEFAFDYKNPQAFRDRRDELRDKVYVSLAPRFILLAQIIAILYVYVTEAKELKELDLVPQEMALKLNFIDEFFADYNNFRKHFSDFLKSPSYYIGRDYKNAGVLDYRKSLMPYVENMVLLMLWMADIVQKNYKQYSNINLPPMNPRFIPDDYRRMYEVKKMRAAYKRLKDGSNGKFSVDNMIDKVLLKKEEVIFRGFFKKMANDWFTQKEFNGSKMANFIVDFVNLGVLEAARGVTITYITEDKPFVKLIRSENDECLRLSQEFYKVFYIGNA